MAATTLPAVVTGPVLGAWLDRTRRRRLALATNQVLQRPACSASWPPPAAFGGVYLQPRPGRAGRAALATGYTSMIPVLVPGPLLAGPAPWKATSFNTAAIAGPAVAEAVAPPPAGRGAVLARGRPPISGPARPSPHASQVEVPAGDDPAPLGATIRQGLALLAGPPVLRGVTVATAVGMGGTGLLTLALPFWAERLGGRPGSADTCGRPWRRGRSSAPWPPPGRRPPGRRSGSCWPASACSASAWSPGRWPRRSRPPWPWWRWPAWSRGRRSAATFATSSAGRRRPLRGQIFTTAGQPQAGRVRNRLGLARPACWRRRRRRPGRRRRPAAPGRRPGYAAGARGTAQGPS